jgi:type II secretion system protein J
MMRNQQSKIRNPNQVRADSGFTLIEILLALAISAIVLVGIGTVFYGAVRLRERTAAAIEASAPISQALGIIRRDLQGALPPGGSGALLSLAGDFRADATGNGSGRLQIFTTTGVLNENDPWSDVQEVVYELRDPVPRGNGSGRDLTRSVVRNVLPTSQPGIVDQAVLPNVQSLEFECYDGMNWQSSWDTSAGNTNLPTAVKVRVTMASENGRINPGQQPYELVVALLAQSRTNQVQSSGGGQ